MMIPRGGGGGGGVPPVPSEIYPNHHSNHPLEKHIYMYEHVHRMLLSIHTIHTYMTCTCVHMPPASTREGPT